MLAIVAVQLYQLSEVDLRTKRVLDGAASTGGSAPPQTPVFAATLSGDQISLRAMVLMKTP